MEWAQKCQNPYELNSTHGWAQETVY